MIPKKFNTFGSPKITYISEFDPETQVNNPELSKMGRINLKLSKWVGLIWEKVKWVSDELGRVGVEMEVGVG